MVWGGRHFGHCVHCSSDGDLYRQKLTTRSRAAQTKGIDRTMEILAQTVADMAWWERAIDRFGFPACALISIAVFLFFIARRLTPHAENIAVAHVKMVNTFSETLPKLAEASEKQTDLLTESLRRDSDFRESINNLGQAIVSAACPERKEQAQKDVDRANRRARSIAPQFRNPPTQGE